MKKFLSLFVALAMVLSLFAGFGAPAAKAATTYAFNTGGDGTVTWTGAAAHTGVWSVAMTVPVPATDKAEIVFTPTVPTTLSGLNMALTSFWTMSTNAHTPYIIVDLTDGINNFTINTDMAAQTSGVWQQYVATNSPQWQWSDDLWYSWAQTLSALGGMTVVDVIIEGAEGAGDANIAYVDDVLIGGVAALGDLTHTLDSIVLVPATVTLAGGATQLFAATATYSDATTATVAATYALTSGVGSVTVGGLYTAPAALLGAQTALITGTYTEGAVTRTATATVTISGTGPGALTYLGCETLSTVNYLTDSTKRVQLNYYSPTVPGGALVGAVPNFATIGTPTFEPYCQFIYKMGDVIHGTVTLPGTASTPYYIQLRTVDGYVVDTVSGSQVAGTTKYPFFIGTANVSFDGPYDVYVATVFSPLGAQPAETGTLVSRVYIQYNITWKTKTILNCTGFNTLEGWITRGNGQTVLVPVTIGIAYPNNALAAKYDVAQLSSGQFALTFAVDPTNINQIGQYRVFVRDGYADGTTELSAPPYVGTLLDTVPPIEDPDNDAMIYEKLGNLPTALSITASTYGSPILLYKNQINQPVVISLMDQDGNPVSGAIWTVKELTTTITTYTVAEISPGYYRFMLNLGVGPDVRFTATKTLFGTAKTSNTVVVALRDLGAFNPYLDIDANTCIQPSRYSCATFDPLTGRYVCDLLPCTIGSSLWLTVGYWDVPASMAANWYIDDASVVVTVNGPVRDLDGSETHWIIEKAGKITASISMNVWERKDTTCLWPVGGYDLTNACCHTYTKSFDVCEVLSCTLVSVAVDGTNITDASNITVGKSSDLVINISGANAPAGLFCGCNTKIVKIYMVDADGNVIADAFTAKTWGGVDKDLSALWYNGIAGSVGAWSAGSLDGRCGVRFENGSDVTYGVNVIDNCEKLTFKDITFNAVTGTACDNHLVVEVFGLYRTFDACGIMAVSYPFISETVYDINVNPVITTLSATATVFEMGIDPTDILAGVPVTIEITDPKFSTATGVQGIVWSATLGGTKLSTLGITMTASPLDTGVKFTFSCAFPKAGDLVITGYQYNVDCTVKEVVTITLKVVMPTFEVKLGLLDGSTIANDHIITEGFGELIYVTATDPRTDGHHDFSTDPNWTLSAVAVTNSCKLPSSLVCYSVPSGCTTPSPIVVSGYDNPHIEDAAQFKLYFVVNGCAKLLVDTFTLASSAVTVNPTEVAFTIPASATHVVFSVKDAHAHGAPGVSVTIVGTTNGVGASGYTFTAGAAKTDKNGEADWAFVPPYSGVYTVSAGFTTLCVLPCSWSGLSASAKITANYKASEIDTTAPVVTLTAGIDGAKVSSSTLNLTGKVTDNVGVTQLFVGFNKVDVLPDGSFMVALKLAEGENTITVVAYDAAGNKGTTTAKVTYTAPVDTKIVLVLTIGADIVSVNGKATSIDAAPEIVASRTFVPMRFIAESFGATVEWLPETQGITITLGDHTVGLQIGNATAVIDGTIVSLPAAPYIKNGRTMVPLRVISEAFGGDVVWDPAARTITITYQP